MTAPVESRTVPVIWPVAVWAEDVAGRLTIIASHTLANARCDVLLMSKVLSVLRFSEAGGFA